GADEGHALTAKMARVKIGIGVEEVSLEPRHEPADRRAQTEIRDPVDGTAGERVVGTVAADAHGIHAKGRLQIVVKTEVRRREADRPPAPVAGGDAAVDLPESTEQRGGPARLPCLQ